MRKKNIEKKLQKTKLRKILKKKRNKTGNKKLFTKRRRRKEEVLEAPNNFSLINNTEEVLSYLNKANELRTRGKNIYFNLRNIEKITPETIALFLANFKNKSYNGDLKIKIGASFPSNPDVSDIFINSGFYEHVPTRRKMIPKNKNQIMARRFYKIDSYNVDTNLAKEAVEMSTTFTNHEKKFRPIYEILIECMANTNNHASNNLENTNKKDKHNWWLNLYNDEKTNISHFTFIDLGVGIFESVLIKRYISIARLKKVFSGNRSLVQDLLDGKIGSSTGESKRGKGFPKIYQHSKHDSIKNFIIISNDVFADVSNGNYITLNNKFNGTFLYWELHKK